MRKSIAVPIVFVLLVLTTVRAHAESFRDVGSGHVNMDAIEYVKTNEIVSGYPDGTYKPDYNINRAEFTKIIMGAVMPEAVKGSNCFPDVKNEWFASFVCAAKTKDIIKGYPDGSFKPGQNISFAEAAKIIMSAFGETVEPNEIWYKPYVERMGQKKAIPGSITTFDKNITRGEMAEIIYRLRASIINKSSQTYMSIASGGGSGSEQELYVDEYADWQTYKNRLQNILIKYPSGWFAVADGNIIKIQNMEGDYNKLNAPENMKWFWIDTAFKPGLVTKNELINNTAQYSGVKREVLRANAVTIDFYNFKDIDCGESARAFWKTSDTEFYAHHANKCGQNLSDSDKALFKKILESFEDF